MQSVSSRIWTRVAVSISYDDNDYTTGKVINWEMCKKSKFDHTNKWYMHNPAAVLENNTHKLQWDFDIQTDHRISARRPDLIIIKKKKWNCKIVDFAVSADPWIKLKECEKKDKTVEHAGDNYTNRNWCFWYSY